MTNEEVEKIKKFYHLDISDEEDRKILLQSGYNAAKKFFTTTGLWSSRSVVFLDAQRKVLPIRREFTRPEGPAWAATWGRRIESGPVGFECLPKVKFLRLSFRPEERGCWRDWEETA